jgi:hypothetical protein
LKAWMRVGVSSPAMTFRPAKKLRIDKKKMFHKNSFLLFVWRHPQIPNDCQKIIQTFLPVHVQERCFMCGLAIVMIDSHDRSHFEPHIVCTESVMTCSECFECFYQ